MSEHTADVEQDSGREYESVDPPVGWDGQTLKEMLTESERRFEETGHYHGVEDLEMKNEQFFEFEESFSKLRGALVSARETALNIASSAITNVAGELCFQIYTPEGDCVVASTGIIVHVHTGSIAIKWMIREDYEQDRGINPGDIFCNNDSDIGNVHTSDIHTIVPVFHDGELVAWVDGVTHQPDTGGITPGESLMAAISRYHDGIYVTCEKIGENDERYQDWEVRSQRAVRTPELWDLDEKCRLAGCHMARRAVKDLIDDIGVEKYKQFTREVIEDSRRTFKEQTKERFVPGTYQETGFMPVPFKDEAWFPRADEDSINHLPVEMTLDSEGTLSLDMDGASSPGLHSYNAAEGTMAGGLWVILTQFLPLKGRVNDGSHYAIETNYPEGSITNPKDHRHSFTNAWSSVIPTLNGIVKGLSRGFFSRGFREEVSSGISRIDTVKGGGTYEPTGEHFPVCPFEISAGGFGASAIRDGIDWGYGYFNPEVEMGDVEDWEAVENGLMYLGRKVKPNTAGFGKYRGGSGWEVVRTVQKSTDVSLFKNRYPGVAFTSYGLNGGYPASEAYAIRAHDTDLSERVEAREPYPISDTEPGTFNSHIEGDIVTTEYGFYWPKAFENDDLFHYQIHGAPGYGDPLERPVDEVKEDVEEEIYTQDVVENVYGVVGTVKGEYEFDVDYEATEVKREDILEERREESVPAEEFWEAERERIVEEDMSGPIVKMYKDIAETSEHWMEDFREFWDLDADAIAEDESLTTESVEHLIEGDHFWREKYEH